MAPVTVENPRIVLIKSAMVVEFEKKEKFTRCHDKMDFRLRHDMNTWSHQSKLGFTLTNKLRGCYASLSTRYAHGLEEEPCEVLDDPLHNADMIKNLHGCHGEMTFGSYHERPICIC